MSYRDEEAIDYGAPPTNAEMNGGVEVIPPFGWKLMDELPSPLVLETGLIVTNRFSPIGENIFDNWYRFVIPGNHQLEGYGQRQLALGSEGGNPPVLVSEFCHIKRSLSFRQIRGLTEVGGMALMFELAPNDHVVMYNSIWFENEADCVLVNMRFNPVQKLTIYDVAEHFDDYAHI